MDPTPDLPPLLQLFRMVTGYYVSRALYVVATLGIADRLANGPRGHEELAKETATKGPALRRVLRLLASVGVFSEEPDGRFALTPNDDCAMQILTTCRRAMGPGARLLIIEGIYPERIDTSSESRGAAANDVNMLVCTGGRQRSDAEFHALYAAAGFTLTRRVPTPPLPTCIIEGVPRA